MTRGKHQKGWDIIKSGSKPVQKIWRDNEQNLKTWFEWVCNSYVTLGKLFNICFSLITNKKRIMIYIFHRVVLRLKQINTHKDLKYYLEHSKYKTEVFYYWCLERPKVSDIWLQFPPYGFIQTVLLYSKFHQQLTNVLYWFSIFRINSDNSVNYIIKQFNIYFS